MNRSYGRKVTAGQSMQHELGFLRKVNLRISRSEICTRSSPGRRGSGRREEVAAGSGRGRGGGGGAEAEAAGRRPARGCGQPARAAAQRTAPAMRRRSPGASRRRGVASRGAGLSASSLAAEAASGGAAVTGRCSEAGNGTRRRRPPGAGTEEARGAGRLGPDPARGGLPVGRAGRGGGGWRRATWRIPVGRQWRRRRWTRPARGEKRG